jgi:hypothetical protein
MTGLIQKAYTFVVPYETRRWLYKLRNPAAHRRIRSVVNRSSKGDFSLRPFDEHRCIFVHITKTAGTSVATGLFGYLPYHHTAIDYRVIYGRKTFNEYFKFAFVRNPWDRLYSAFRYLKAGGWDEKDRQWAAEHLAGIDDFDTFVREWITRDMTGSHLHFRPQSEFICDGRNRLLVDYLGYFETLQQDFGEIAARLGIDTTLESRNVSPVGSYRDVYDETTRKIVADIYARDIDLFGYDFDGIRRRRRIEQ